MKWLAWPWLLLYSTAAFVLPSAADDSSIAIEMDAATPRPCYVTNFGITQQGESWDIVAFRNYSRLWSIVIESPSKRTPLRVMNDVAKFAVVTGHGTIHYLDCTGSELGQTVQAQDSPEDGELAAARV